MRRVLFCLVAAAAACRSAPGPARHSDLSMRPIEQGHLAEALAEPSLGVVFGVGRGKALVLPLQRRGRVELLLPGPKEGVRLVLEVEVKDPAVAVPVAELPLALAVASAAAARALGTDPARFHWRAQLGDGAAAPPLWASAQMAGGLVAALAGWPIARPRAAALGAIGPDGALVAVPAMAEAMTSWAAAGRVVGLPVGSTSRPELAAAVRAAGAVPRELASLAEVVALLTQRELPASEVATAALLADPPAARAAWSEPYVRGRAALAGRWDQVLVLDGAPHVPVALRALAERAGLAAALAERLASQGEHEAALVAQASATALAAAVLDARALVDAAQLGHIDQALDAAGLLVGAEPEAAALVVELAQRGQGAAVAASDELALALEAWALGPALRAAEQALAAELGELRGRELSELGTAATAARLAASAVPLAQHAAQIRATLELARLLAARPRRAAPGELERLAALPAGTAVARQWLAELERGAGRARERDEAVLASAATGLPRTPAAFSALAEAPWRWCDVVLRGVGDAAAWRVLVARVRRVPAAEAGRELALAARSVAASARAAQLVVGAVPPATKFWHAAGRAFATAGAPLEAAQAYGRARAAAELALAVARPVRPGATGPLGAASPASPASPASEPAGGPDGPRR